MKRTCWMGEQEQALAVKKINWQARKGQLACQKKTSICTKNSPNCQLQGKRGHSNYKCERVDAKSKPPRPTRSLNLRPTRSLSPRTTQSLISSRSNPKKKSLPTNCNCNCELERDGEDIDGYVVKFIVCYCYGHCLVMIYFENKETRTNNILLI